MQRLLSMVSALRKLKCLLCDVKRESTALPGEIQLPLVQAGVPREVFSYKPGITSLLNRPSLVENIPQVLIG